MPKQWHKGSVRAACGEFLVTFFTAVPAKVLSSYSQAQSSCIPFAGAMAASAGAGGPVTRVRPGTAPTFDSLQPRLSATTLEVVKTLGFKHLTPVQAATIPLFLTNKDVAVEVS